MTQRMPDYKQVTNERLTEAIIDMADGYGTLLKPERLKIYLRQLGDFDAALFEKVIADLYETSDYFPSIAAFHQSAKSFNRHIDGSYRMDF